MSDKSDLLAELVAADATIRQQRTKIERLIKEVAELRAATGHSWKAVTERLPDEGQEVLVVSPCPNSVAPNIDIASWGEEGQQGPVWREPDCARVHPTHWFPLPKPPAVEGE